MEKITRWNHTIIHETSDDVESAMVVNSHERFVKHEDHAAIVAELQEQVRALAAENAALARYFSATTRAIENWNSWADTEDKLDSSPEIPATDAAIREIRAQAVEQFAEACLTANNGHEIHPDIEEIRDYATRIRAGEQP